MLANVRYPAFLKSRIKGPEGHLSNIEAADLPHLTNFSQAYFSPGQRAEAHSHSDMFEVFLVESGSGIIRVDGEEHRLEKGTCVVVQPGEVHEIVNSGAGVLVLTYFGLEA